MSQSATVQGSDAVALRSAQAVTRVVQQLGTAGRIRSAFQAAGSSADITSCSATVSLLMETVPGPVVAGRMSVLVKPGLLKFWERPQSMLMSSDALVTEIVRLLNDPIAMCISIKRDHHFLVLPIDGERVGIIQAFQGSYNLADWLAWRGVGTFLRGEFEQSLRDLVSDSRDAWTAAALRLFALQPGDSAPAGTTLTVAGVQQDIREWFDIRPYIVQYAYKSL